MTQGQHDEPDPGKESPSERKVGVGLMKQRSTFAIAVLVLGLAFPVTSVANAGPILVWSPTTSSGSYDFGTVAPGQSSSTTFTLTNKGGSATGALKVTLSGSAAFAITANRCKASLGPKRTCSITIRYTPVSGISSDNGVLVAKGSKPNTTANLAVAGTSVLPRQIYWSNTGFDTIGRANVDGQSANQNFITGSIQPTGMAIDSAHLYWANTPRSVGRADLDGQNVNSSFLAVFQVYGVDVDPGHVYFAHTDPDPSLTGIGRADLDGQNPDSNFIVGTTDPFDVAADAGHIYWADCGTNSIGRADLNGQNVNLAFVAGASCPVSVAVDAGHVYWTNSGTNSIGRADISGQNVNQSFITGASFPFGITVDSTYIYWTNAAGDSIGRSDINGQNVNQSFITGASGPRGVAVDPG